MPFQHPQTGWNPFSLLPTFLPEVCFSIALVEEISVISETHERVKTRASFLEGSFGLWKFRMFDYHAGTVIT